MRNCACKSDDGSQSDADAPRSVMARSPCDEAIQAAAAEGFWIALLARNDEERASVKTRLSCPGRSAASLRRCAAEPGPMLPHCTVSPPGPGSAQQRCTLQRVRDTEASDFPSAQER